MVALQEFIDRLKSWDYTFCLHNIINDNQCHNRLPEIPVKRGRLMPNFYSLPDFTCVCLVKLKLKAGGSRLSQLPLGCFHRQETLFNIFFSPHRCIK